MFTQVPKTPPQCCHCTQIFICRYAENSRIPSGQLDKYTSLFFSVYQYNTTFPAEISLEQTLEMKPF